MTAAAARSNQLTVEKKTFTEKQTVEGVAKTYSYEAWAIIGWLNGKRVRKQAPTHREALALRHTLEIEAADADGAVRALPTRLTPAQLAMAETLYALAPEPLAAVQWYLANYRPPQYEKLLGTPEIEATAVCQFLADRAQHVRPVFLGDYKRTLTDFGAAFPGKNVHEISTEDVQAFLGSRRTRAGVPIGKKRFNNMRGELHAFFVFCLTAPRKWLRENPVTPIPAFRITRKGLPEIVTAGKAAEIMAFAEGYGPERNLPAGCLVPYFALCLFAGIRPDVLKGEIGKLGASPDIDRLVALDLGVIRITPEISKVKDVRQITIRPNLRAWLERYPLKKFPLIPAGARNIVQEVRQKLGIGQDVMRHTFISAHVAKFKSIGEAALEAGNSERMIKKHYYNTMTDAAANAFWSIVPAAAQQAEAAA